MHIRRRHGLAFELETDWLLSLATTIGSSVLVAAIGRLLVARPVLSHSFVVCKTMAMRWKRPLCYSTVSFAKAPTSAALAAIRLMGKAE